MGGVPEFEGASSMKLRSMRRVSTPTTFCIAGVPVESAVGREAMRYWKVEGPLTRETTKTPLKAVWLAAVIKTRSPSTSRCGLLVVASAGVAGGGMAARGGGVGKVRAAPGAGSGRFGPAKTIWCGFLGARGWGR